MGAVNSLVNSVAFPAPPRGFSEPDLLRRPDLLFLHTAKGQRLPAVHRRFAGAGPRFTLIYSHGNAEDVGLSLAYVELLSRELRADVVAYEYVGYSIADGDPSEAGVYESADAAWSYVTQDCRIPPSGVLLLGRSLGSAPTVHLAGKHTDAAGMILQSPLASGLRVLAGVPVSLLLRPFDPFKNYAKIGKVKCPSVVIHGDADDVVPFWNGVSLHDKLAARGLARTPLWVEGCGHNNMPEDRCVRHMHRFVQTLPPPPPAVGAEAKVAIGA